MQREDAIVDFVFHLTRGIVKAIPVLGSVIDEVVFEQYKDKLRSEVAILTDEDLNKLEEKLPQIDVESLSNQFENIETSLEDLQSEAINQFTASLTILGNMRHQQRQIEINTDKIPTILDLVESMEKHLANRDEMQHLLFEVKQKREAWVNRISHNQVRLLNLLNEFQLLETIWPEAQNLLEGCTYKEFRMRLHELEWLSLVKRQRINNSWSYQRTSEGNQLVLHRLTVGK